MITWEEMLQDLSQSRHRLSEWERGFIDNLGSQRAAKPRDLTEQEAAVIDQIWLRVCAE